MSTKITILCVAAASVAAGSVEAATCPIAAEVSARRPTVMLGEPIDLTLILRNTAAGAIELRAPSEIQRPSVPTTGRSGEPRTPAGRRCG